MCQDSWGSEVETVNNKMLLLVQEEFQSNCQDLGSTARIDFQSSTAVLGVGGVLFWCGREPSTLRDQRYKIELAGIGLSPRRWADTRGGCPRHRVHSILSSRMMGGRLELEGCDTIQIMREVPRSLVCAL
ncbi:hypothetical protein JTE90_023213 [Oedothorax gibbosus]|uniref:Uncharacterized protein n=1 Tax=Oedothorax gibbosus TaxID=931172 RepID=A0AAV6VLC8_9ARAC|nr:hypothetical protein JTE90_023213 [Oedothorax gibbosus]